MTTGVGKVLAFTAFSIAKRLLSGSDKLTWSTVNDWIVTNSNLDNYGRGYSGNNLLPNTTAAYAQLHKEPMGANGYRVSASIFLNARSGAIATHAWEAKKLDAELEKVFGRNLRVRIDV